jgi:hypothetical protein
MSIHTLSSTARFMTCAQSCLANNSDGVSLCNAYATCRAWCGRARSLQIACTIVLIAGKGCCCSTITNVTHFLFLPCFLFGTFQRFTFCISYFHGPSLDTRLEPLALSPEFSAAVAASDRHRAAGYMAVSCLSCIAARNGARWRK